MGPVGGFPLGPQADDMAGDFLLRIGTDVNGQQLEAAHASPYPSAFHFLRTVPFVTEEAASSGAHMFPELFVGKRPRAFPAIFGLFQTVAPEFHHAKERSGFSKISNRKASW